MKKGELTRDRIVDLAITLASRIGLEGLTIGSLASELKLSKSGLFAHFGSKEELQLRVLEQSVSQFELEVFHPALKAPRGEPRLRTLFDNWLAWGQNPRLPGGCIIVTANVEFDDRPGPLRDLISDAQTRLLEGLARAARIAVEVGHFREDVDPDQFAFELYGLVLAHHFVSRVRRDPAATQRTRAAFERLLSTSRP